MPEAPAPPTSAELFCSKCRRPMEKKIPTAGGGGGRVLPHIVKIRSYKRIASEQNVPFSISEHAACELMRAPCVVCGLPAPADGNGLTRLRIWPPELRRPSKGGFMGPYDIANLSTACSMCNLMKGFRSVRGIVEAARHIASHRGGTVEYGRYPRRFRDNVSRRSRSAYITASSTHSKTHALSNEQFSAIVARPCRNEPHFSHVPHPIPPISHRFNHLPRSL